MRLEILETVPTPDQEMVLRALEMCSREVSSKVVRYGDRITLQGLGPSPRAKNVRDTTVFHVNADNDKTIISGEVSFQASALLGDQPQGDVVRSKLEELFNQMKAQIIIDEQHAVSSALSLPTAPIEAGSVGPTDLLEEDNFATFVQNQEPETRDELPGAGSANAVSACSSELASVSEQNGESDRSIPAEQNARVEPNVEVERNAWLDELFSQLKAQGDLEEGLAMHGAATAPIAAQMPSITDVTDSVVEDVLQKASDKTVASDGSPEIVIASSEYVLAESDSVGLEETAKPKQTAPTEQNVGVEQNVELKRSAGKEQSFDLKENAWLEELFNQMNAQIDVEDERIAQGVISERSIDTALPPTTETATSDVYERVSPKEAAPTFAPETGSKAISGIAESRVEDELSVAESKPAAESEQETKIGNAAELSQNVGATKSVDQESPSSEGGAELEQNALSHPNAQLKESSGAVQAPKAEHSVDPGQSVWLQQVIELDRHAPRPLEERPLLVARAEEAPPRKRLGKWMTGVVVLLLAAAGGYFYRNRFNPEVPPIRTTEQPASITTNSLPAAEPSHVTNARPPLFPPRTQIADPAVQVADIRVWLANWGTAMRTRDASAQAAFYADTVDQYVGKYDVSKDAVLKDREATIHMRKGLWTVKMEKVVIERQTKSEAEVRLVKHFIDETAPSEIVESFVPTHLKLKRVAGGGWRITSEQDLPSSLAPQSR